jgi:hypothetical protein
MRSHQLIRANVVGTCVLSFLSLVTFGHNNNAQRLARAVRATRQRHAPFGQRALGSTPRRTAMSTLSVKFGDRRVGKRAHASSSE